MALVINDRVKVNSRATGNSQTTFEIDNTPLRGFIGVIHNIFI